MPTEPEATRRARKRYERVARFYDLVEAMMERSAGKWRRLQWSKVEGRHILEVGVGTGKNFPYYPAGAHITAIDFSPKMLERARAKAARRGIKVDLQLMDVQHLPFADDTFDTVVATFVFCSVPDPVAGLKEVRRVCRTEGKIVLLEHVRSNNRIVGWLMDVLNWLMSRVMWADINRRTVDNVELAGLKVEQAQNLAAGIFYLIEARK